MLIAYTLSMPLPNSWNGRWSGEGRCYGRVRSYTGKKRLALAELILQRNSYHYSWTDGWGARVNVEKIEPRAAAALRRKSNGFCGYDWMIDSIEARQKILADHEISDKHADALTYADPDANFNTDPHGYDVSHPNGHFNADPESHADEHAERRG